MRVLEVHDSIGSKAFIEIENIAKHLDEGEGTDVFKSLMAMTTAEILEIVKDHPENSATEVIGNAILDKREDLIQSDDEDYIWGR